MESHQVILILCVCLALSGCTVFESPNGQSTAAPGLDSAGVEDPDELARAHADILDNSSYTFNRTEIRSDENGTRVGATNTTTKVASNHSVFYSVITQTRPAANQSLRTESYSNGTQTWVARTTTEETTIENITRTAPDYGGVSSKRDRLYLVFDSFQTTVNSQVERESQDVFLVQSTDFHQKNIASITEFETIENAELYAYIGTDGFVHEYRITYTGRGPQTAGPVTVDIHVTYHNVDNTTVRRPIWLG